MACWKTGCREITEAPPLRLRCGAIVARTVEANSRPTGATDAPAQKDLTLLPSKRIEAMAPGRTAHRPCTCSSALVGASSSQRLSGRNDGEHLAIVESTHRCSCRWKRCVRPHASAATAREFPTFTKALSSASGDDAAARRSRTRLRASVQPAGVGRPSENNRGVAFKPHHGMGIMRRHKDDVGRGAEQRSR